MAWARGGVSQEPEDEKNPYHDTRKFWRNKLKGDCVEMLIRDGWNVYTRGFPTIFAEKGNFMRMIVVKPAVQFGKRVKVGLRREKLSQAFFKCFGVKYEIWEQAEEAPKEGDWL